MTIDTYELANGYRAELVEVSDFRDKNYEYSIHIKKKKETLVVFMEYYANPFDAIFILMDLGLIHADYTLGETLQNHPLAPKKYYQP